MNWKARMAALAVTAAVGVNACSGSDEGTGYPSEETRPTAGGYDTYDDVYDNIMDDYFDGCQWSMGCGGLTGAWSGADSNSITGEDEIEPLG